MNRYKVLRLEEYSIEQATHFLDCVHAIGSGFARRREYQMQCILLGKTKSGAFKLLVFEERDWKDRDDKKQIRYIPENQSYRIHEKLQNPQKSPDDKQERKE